MEESIAGGMYGALSIRGRREKLPDHEFLVVFAPMGDFQTIGGRAFVGNTPVFKARLGERVQWDVIAHGQRLPHLPRPRPPLADARRACPRTRAPSGPAESFRVRWRERATGTWLYHCHVEDHMMRGMIGLYRVAR